jgi:hypothetical protein
MPVKCEWHVTLTFSHHSGAITLFDYTMTNLTGARLGSVPRAVLAVFCVFTVTVAVTDRFACAAPHSGYAGYVLLPW